MDKKNQHDDLGGLHNKPSPKALPPLWEDIAGAMDAADGKEQGQQGALESDGEHEQQVADFSVIKAGFVSTFGQQEPPKFLWDTIEQDLEATIETDAPTEFSSIKDSFLATFGQQEPPQSLWKALSERVDHPEAEIPAQEKATYTNIKNSFERKYSAIIVPLFSWSDLVERMDTEAILADTPDRFSCIKESFEAIYAQQEPSAAVTAGLWSRLYPLAPFWGSVQQVAGNPWMKRGAVALLLLMAWGAWYTISPSQNTLATNESSTKTLEIPSANRAAKGITTKENTSSTTSPLAEETTSYRTFGPWMMPEDVALSKTWEEADAKAVEAAKVSHMAGTLNLTTKRETIDALHVTIGSVPLVEENRTDDNLAQAPIKPNEPFTEGNKDIKRATTLALTQNTEQEPTTNTTNLGMVNKGTGSTTTQKATLLSNQEESFSSAFSNPKNTTTLKSLSVNGKALETPILPAADIHLVEEGWTTLSRNYIPDPAIAWMEANNFTEVRPAIRGKKVHFEFGVEGRLGTSVLLENKGMEEADKETILCPTGAVGVNFQYYFGMNDALVVGAYPYSSTIQCWGKPSPNGGAPEIVDMRLAFMDFTVGYQRVLLRYSGYSEQPASIYARVNLGMGWLTNANTRVNQQSIATPGLYKNFNWSAGLALGNLHQLQRFVLDYGLMGNIGLNSFVTGAQPNVLQPARIVNVGAYLGLRYLFTPRRAPSKKQRQFDWSAPFYIEEPKF